MSLEATPGWKTIRRETGLVEHVCEHGTGHPNYYSARRIDRHYGHEKFTWSTHGCCGCCNRNDFPGHKLSDQAIIDRLKRQLVAFDNGDGPIDEMISWVVFNGHDLQINLVDALEDEAPSTIPEGWA